MPSQPLVTHWTHFLSLTHRLRHLQLLMWPLSCVSSLGPRRGLFVAVWLDSIPLLYICKNKELVTMKTRASPVQDLRRPSSSARVQTSGPTSSAYLDATSRNKSSRPSSNAWTSEWPFTIKAKPPKESEKSHSPPPVPSSSWNLELFTTNVYSYHCNEIIISVQGACEQL